jgi:hypothetical protein
MLSGLLPNTGARCFGLVVTRVDRSLLGCHFGDCLRRGSIVLRRVFAFLKFIRDRHDPIIFGGGFKPLV